MYKINKYSGITGVVYIDTIPKKFVAVQTKRGFSLPGGGIEKSDPSLESAMYRELKEELGFDRNDFEIKNTNLNESFVYGKDKTGRSNEKALRLIFLIRAKKEKLNPKDKEIINANWYTYEEIIKIFSWKNSKETLNKCIKLLN